VPFFVFYNGFESISLFLGSLSRVGGKRGPDDTAQLSFSKMLIYPLNVLRIRLTDLTAAGSFFKYFTTVACVISTFFVKKRWKAVLLCACIVYGFQDMCVGYMLTFFILPLILMLDEETERKPINYVYIICFILIFAPIPLAVPSTGVWTRYAMEKVSSFAVGAMTGLAVIESFSDIFGIIENRFAIKKSYTAITTIFAVALFLVIEVFVNPCAWFNTGIGVSSDHSSADTVKTVVSLIVIVGAWVALMVFFRKKSVRVLPERKETADNT